MTEEEAKTKWCPMGRLENRSPASWTGAQMEAAIEALKQSGAPLDFNSIVRIHAKCIASNCMMWRVHSHFGGHCGLAGTP